MNGESIPQPRAPAAVDSVAPQNPRRPLKRQRVSQACSTCRDRKTRCDGRQPVCMACEQRGVASTCKFDHIRRPRASRPSCSRTQTEDRIENSSRPDTAEPIARSDAAQVLSDLGRGHQPVFSERKSLLAPAPLATASHVVPHHNGIIPDSPRSRSHKNGNWAAGKADGLALIAAENDNSMYGPSSSVAFLRHVMPGHSRHGSSTPERNHNMLRPRSSGVPDRLPTKADGLAVLPRRGQADNFLFCFWEFVHPLFPVLHRPTFLDKYARLWTEHDVQESGDREAEEAIFSATLNLVFALGCKFSPSVESSQKASVGDDFYQRARQSYPYDILDSTSTALVQMLVLTGVYLQSTERASRCWNSVGLAIRVAQSLGLHVDHSSGKATSQLDLEMRRRIWHTCIHLDRLLSMTFGRPSMIDQKINVPVPALIDDEYLTDARGMTSTQPRGVPSRLGLFISSCTLFELLEEILDLFNRDNSGVSSQRQANGVTEASQLLEPVLTLNRMLDQFMENIPEYLRAPAAGAVTSMTDDHVHLQQQVLYSRFLYVRLLSLRPLLLMATRREPRPAATSSLDDDVIRSCCKRCIVTACRLINTLHSNLGTLYRSSGWHTVYFTFTSAIVLLASSKLEDVQSQIASTDIEASWDRVYVILDHYANQIQSANQASQILKTMKTKTTDVSRTQAVKQGLSLPNEPHADPTSNMQSPAPEAEIYPPLSFDELDISEAWYGQHLINLDWLELPQV